MALANSWLADLLEGIKTVIWNGITFSPRDSIRFLGGGVASVVDNANNDSTDVTINGGGSAGVYGDGSDGTATCDGTSTVAGMTLSGGGYTLTRDVVFTSLTVSVGVLVNCAGWRMFALTLVNNGHIHADGSQGAADSTNVAGGGGTGISSLSGGGYGWGGATDGESTTGLGGNGGVGAISGSTGGQSTPITQSASLRTLPYALMMLVPGTVGEAGGTTLTWYACGGGAGGGSGGSGGGPGGGSGGGVLVVAALTLSGTTGSFTANGGPGGASLGSGAGGGGGGGVVALVTGTSTFTGSIQVNGGAPGVGSGGTNVPTAGAAGTVIQLKN